jgi:hypothetical protein
MAHVTDQLNTALADRYVIEWELGAGGMALDASSATTLREARLEAAARPAAPSGLPPSVPLTGRAASSLAPVANRRRS